MAEEHARSSRLGRGLAALLGDAEEETTAGGRAGAQRRVPIEFLRPNPRNPRKNFDDDELEDLAHSIRERGVIQPIVVRPIPRNTDAYEIVAGERRWRAAQRAGLHDVPVLIVEAGDREALEIAIIENVQRTDLNPLEEAAGYQQLMSDFGYSQNELAKIIGKSRSHVANTLRLLKLPDNARIFLASGEISAGHARALLSVSDPADVARKIVDRGLTVRDVERIAQKEQRTAPPSGEAGPASKDPDTRELEKSLSDATGLVVTIHGRGEGGEVRVRYRSLEQLNHLAWRLSRPV